MRAAWSSMLVFCLAAHAAEPVSDTGSIPEGCAPSLQRLDAARLAKAAPGRVEALRREATEACLGAPAAARPGTRALAPPVAVTPVPSGPPAVPAGARAATPTAPLAIDRPAMINNCDATGCWDAQGQRLNRMGDWLIGPRGPCIAQGVGFVCP